MRVTMANIHDAVELTDSSEKSEQKETVVLNSCDDNAKSSDSTEKSEEKETEVLNSCDDNAKSLDSTEKSEDNETVFLNRCDDNAESSVVLNKTAEETLLNNLSMQDSTTVSYNNSLTSISSEIKDRLSDVLIENIKLKNILMQKNDDGRKKFETMVNLKNQMVQVCGNYKKKFSEVKDLVNQLKEENAELQQATIKLKNNPMHAALIQTENESEINQALTKREQHIIGQIRELSQKLKIIESSYLQSQSDLQVLESRREDDLECFSKQISKSNDELERFIRKLESPNTPEFVKLFNTNCKRHLDMAFFMEVIANSALKVQKFNCEDKSKNERTDNFRDNPLYDENAMFTEKFYDFLNLFIHLCASYVNIEKFSEECSNIIDTLKQTQICFKNDITGDNFAHVEELDYGKILIEEQLQSINDENIIINVQKQLLKELEDYNNVVSELEILKYENSRLVDVNCITSNDNINNFAKIEQCILVGKAIPDVEKLSIGKEKQLIREEREILEAEETELLKEKDQLLKENEQIIAENLELKQTIKSLQSEERFQQSGIVYLENNVEAAVAERNILKQELKNTHEIVLELREKVKKITDYEDDLSAYKIQVEMHEMMHSEMMETERNFLAQIEILSNDLLRLQDENLALRDEYEVPD